MLRRPWESTEGSHTWSVLLNDLVNRSSFNVVDDVVARTGNQMAVPQDGHILLYEHSAQCAG